MTEEEKEIEQWQLMHALRGDHTKPGHCELKCGDPTCNTGCLRQEAAMLFRSDIMHGVEIARKNGSPLYPLTVPAASKKDCLRRPLSHCHDPVCQIVGCMERSAYNFRDLIKMAQENKLIKALKK